MYITFFAKNIEKTIKIDYTKRMNEKFNYHFENSTFKFNYSKGTKTEEFDIHPYHELLYFIGGKGVIHTEAFKQELKEKSLIFIPKGKYHSFRIVKTNEFERLKISFESEEIFKLLKNAYTESVKVLNNPSSIILSLLERICFCISGKTDNELFIHGATLTALSEFSNTSDRKDLWLDVSPLIADCIRYVEDNIDKDLSISAISKHLNFSPSTLFHMFKKEMGDSLHRYVVQRRLIYAKSLLDAGKRPTEIYDMCGYTNYSSFYKAYVKMFKVNPKN